MGPTLVGRAGGRGARPRLRPCRRSTQGAIKGTSRSETAQTRVLHASGLRHQAAVRRTLAARRGRTGSRLELNGAILNDSIIRLLAGELRRQPSGPALRSPPDLGRKSARRFARSYKPRFVMPGTRLGETVVRRSTCALASSTLSPARAARGRLTWSERLGPFPNVPTGDHLSRDHH